MSYILEAIRKSEQERASTDQVPDLNSVHHSNNIDDTAPSNPYSLWLFAGMAITIIVLLALLLTRYFNSEPTAVAAARQHTTDPATSATSQTLPKAEVMPSQAAAPTANTQTQLQNKSVADNTTETASIAQVAPSPVNNKPTIDQASTKQSAVAAQPERTDIQTLYQQQKNQAQIDTLKAPMTLKNLPTENQVAKLNEALAQRQTVAEPKPQTRQYQSVFELPEAITQQIPSLKFGAHIYSETTDSGFTIINGRKYLPGSEISPGLTLLRIQPSQVILKFRGYEFSMPAMRDWVKR